MRHLADEYFPRAKLLLLAVFVTAGIAVECRQAHAGETATAYFAGGCFWCVEKDFEGVPGVLEAESGFMGGSVPNPSYRTVTKGKTGHVEAVRITYDPGRVSYDQLLHLFFRSVDPTDAGGQFCDRGSTYTTAIFVASDAERKQAQAAKARARRDLGRAVVTPIRGAAPFYPAEAYHQDYYKKSDIVITRYGPLTKARAYARYREGCGRDRRVKELWGDAAPFVPKARS